MPYNGSGVFTLAQAPFVPNTPISSSAVNSDFSDIATNGLSNAVTKDGQTTITGQLKGASGSVGLPSYSFSANTNMGMYRHGAGELGFSTNGTVAGYFDIAQKFWMLGAADIAGALSVVGAQTGAAATFSGLLTLSSTDHMVPPSGTTAQRPVSPTANNLRYNTDTNQLEYYNGTGWASLRAATDPPQGAFKNLSIKVLTNTTVALAADAVITSNGTLSQNTAVSGTINLGTNGAANALDTGTIAINSWYAIWTIAKADGTTAGLASLSATAPTLPTGYTYKARVGWVRTINASAALYGTFQFGRRAQYVVGLSGTSAYPQMGTTTSSSATAISVSNFVPTTASEISVIGANATGNIVITVSANANTAQAAISTSNPSIGSAAEGAGIAVQGSWSFVLESTNVYAATSGGTLGVNCAGWVDNL